MCLLYMVFFFFLGSESADTVIHIANSSTDNIERVSYEFICIFFLKI